MVATLEVVVDVVVVVVVDVALSPEVALAVRTSRVKHIATPEVVLCRDASLLVGRTGAFTCGEPSDSHCSPGCSPGPSSGQYSAS